MKNLGPPKAENTAVGDVLLETIVSAHYLVLQLRLLSGAEGFSRPAETELMADTLSRWAQLAGDTLGRWEQFASPSWRDGQPDVANFAQIQQ